MEQRDREGPLLAVIVLLASLMVAACGGGDSGTPPAADANACTPGPAGTPVDTPFCRGKANFHDRTLAGSGSNGRACSDCHMDSESFQLTPAAAQQRFALMTTTGTDDPLFRAIDADDFRVNGAAAHDFTNLTQNGLIRVTLPLPANVKLLDCGAKVPCPAAARPTAETEADVWRSVPSIFDATITGPDGATPLSPRGPNPSGGYQLDGRIDTLQNQALSALRNHAATRNDPPASFLDDLASFQSGQFSSPSVKALSDAIAAHASPLPDPDPVLDSLEVAGKAVFDSVVRPVPRQHGRHPSGSTPIEQGTPGTPTALIRYHSIQSACPRPVDTVNPPRFVFAACSASQMENVRTYEITNSGAPPSGTPCGGAPPQPACVTRVTISDPGRMLLTGYPVLAAPVTSSTSTTRACAESAAPRPTSTTILPPRSKTCSSTTSSSSSSSPSSNRRHPSLLRDRASFLPSTTVRSPTPKFRRCSLTCASFDDQEIAMSHRVLGLTFALALAALAPADAAAIVQRTFVASTGNDANPCSLAQPCRGFARAITQTSPSGEVIVLDSAGYGPVIDHEVRVDHRGGGIHAGITVFSGDGITVNIPGGVVVLRGSTISGQGGENGIHLLAAQRLRVESCVISNMGVDGVMHSANATELIVIDTIARDNGGSGIGGDSNAFVVLDHVRSEHNGTNWLLHGCFGRRRSERVDQRQRVCAQRLEGDLGRGDRYKSHVRADREIGRCEQWRRWNAGSAPSRMPRSRRTCRAMRSSEIAPMES